MTKTKIGGNLNSIRFTNREGSINEYLKEISSIDRFETPEDEYICAMKAYNGDENAREELIIKNLRFVISVAKQYETQKCPLNELINEGNIGLIEASHKFDPTKGFKFISFAIWDIRAAIISYIKNKSKMIRLPNNKHNQVSKINKLKSKMEQELHRDITNVDLLSAKDIDMDIDIDTIIELSNMDVVSMNKKINSTDELILEDLIHDKYSDLTDNMTVVNSQNEFMSEILSSLTDREMKILELSFGLNGNEILPLHEIGDKLNLSREGVRQIKNKTLLKLKNKLNNESLALKIFDF
jgi:RNA polymerase primary sigma factor